MPEASRLGDKSKAPVDVHGCAVEPHVNVQGPAVQGSANVSINDRPAFRVGDMGIHMVCCGTNTWKSTAGSSTVDINGRAAVRKGDATQHCGGSGNMIDGSSNVFIGDGTAAAMKKAGRTGAPCVEVPGSRLEAGASGKAAKKPKDAPKEIPPKGIKRLKAELHTVSQPCQKQAKAALKKMDEGKSLTQNEKNKLAEGLGEIGGQEALKRQGGKGDKRFVNRYHGADHMGKDKDGNMKETEFKGSVNNSTAISKHSDNNKQLSHEANEKRSNKFIKTKKRKIDESSKRIGGTYTQEEMALHKEISRNSGKKQMQSTHTNVATGEVNVFERGEEGEIINQTDSFNFYE